MRFLIDKALSLLVASGLRRVGHDAVNVRERDMQSVSDHAVPELAIAEERVLISDDNDFGALLALRQSSKPSFILLRGDVERRPDGQVAVLLDCLPTLTEHLGRGAVAVITRDRLRIRHLPIPGD